MLITSSVSPPMSPTLPMSGGANHHHNHFTSIHPPTSATNLVSRSSRVGGNLDNGGSVPPPASGTLTIFPPTSTRLISHKYDDSPATVPVIQRANSNNGAINSTENYHKPPSSSNHSKGAVTQTPLPLPAVTRDSYSDCGVMVPPPALVAGHPREGQAASLLGGKYLLLEEIEGASLHRCLHIETNQEFICKVSKNSAF